MISEQVSSLIAASRRILISGHMRADGDCLGAQSVLYHALAGLGKSVQILNPDPPDPRYGFLHEHTPFAIHQAGRPLPEYDLLFVCDCSMLARLGPMEALVRARPQPRIPVDHHEMSSEDRELWTAFVHDVAAPSAGMLALKLARHLKAELPLQALEAAFVSLASDTGWFRYSSADARAWGAASELVAAGVRPERLYSNIYQANDAGRPMGLSKALETVEYHRDGRVALAHLSQSHLEEVGGSLEDTDEVLDVLRSVGAVEAVAFLFERADGVLKASLRSKNEIDVNQVARGLGGGGHAYAAGVNFGSETELPQALERLRAALLDAHDALMLTSGS